MDEKLLNLIGAVKRLDKTPSKIKIIKFITDEFEIPNYMCDECKTNSFIHLKSGIPVYCLYCDKLHAYADCEKCGGRGIIEGDYGEEMEEEELAVCLKCEKEIPKEVCSVDETHIGYNYRREYAGLTWYGEDDYQTYCPDCWNDTHPHVGDLYDYDDRDVPRLY